MKYLARYGKIIVPLVLSFILIVVLGVTVIGGNLVLSTSDANIQYALGSGAADQIPPSYLQAYQAAGHRFNVPWTVLAGIGQVATDQGRSAPSDVTDYGKRIDRYPQGGAMVSLSSATTSSASSGTATSSTTPSKKSSTTSTSGTSASGTSTTTPKRSTGVATNPSWTNCGGANCTVVPIIGAKPGEAEGPLLLDANWLAKNSQGLNPQSITDASVLLAGEMSNLRNTLVESGQYTDYRSNPQSADGLWNAVIAALPVDLPNVTGISNSACSLQATPPPSANWAWPVSNPDTVALDAGFGATTSMVGMDLGASAGESVLSAGSGTVEAVGYEAGGAGNYVIVNHGSGYSSTYAHLDTVNVTKGQKVAAGAVLGTVGATGTTTGGAVLYFSMSNHGVPFDPTTILGKYPGPTSSTGPTDLNVNAGGKATSVVLAGSTSAGTPLNPCTGLPVVVVASAQGQQVVGSDGCPQTTPNLGGLGTIRETNLSILQICEDSIKQAATPQAALAIQAALKHLGLNYTENVDPAQGPVRTDPGWSDCSSYVSRMFSFAGMAVDPAGSTYTIADAAWAVPEPASAARPGDIVEVANYGHVALVLADGLIAENSGTGDYSHVDPNWIQDGHYYRVDPSKVGQGPRNSSSLVPDASNYYASNSTTAGPAVQYAIYFGGDFPGDTRGGSVAAAAAAGSPGSAG